MNIRGKSIRSCKVPFPSKRSEQRKDFENTVTKGKT